MSGRLKGLFELRFKFGLFTGDLIDGLIQYGSRDDDSRFVNGVAERRVKCAARAVFSQDECFSHQAGLGKCGNVLIVGFRPPHQPAAMSRPA